MPAGVLRPIGIDTSCWNAHMCCTSGGCNNQQCTHAACARRVVGSRSRSPGPYQGLAELLALLLPLTVRRANTLTAPRYSSKQGQRTHTTEMGSQITASSSRFADPRGSSTQEQVGDQY